MHSLRNVPRTATHSEWTQTTYIVEGISEDKKIFSVTPMQTSKYQSQEKLNNIFQGHKHRKLLSQKSEKWLPLEGGRG